MVMENITKESILESLATAGYNIGFGAKKHFATFDMVEKLPGIISLLVIFIGIGQLAYPNNRFNTGISTILILVSIMAYSMSVYNSDKEKYERTGKRLTDLFYEVRTLYFKVRDSDKENFETELKEMQRIENEYNEISISKQIFGSNWYAHYKFFAEMQTDWIKEQRKLTFLKDMVPKSLIFFILVFALCCFGWYFLFVKGGKAC